MAGLALLTPVHGSSWSAGNPGGDGDELHDTSLRNEARNACHYRKDNYLPHEPSSRTQISRRKNGPLSEKTWLMRLWTTYREAQRWSDRGRLEPGL